MLEVVDPETKIPSRDLDDIEVDKSTSGGTESVLFLSDDATDDFLYPTLHLVVGMIVIYCCLSVIIGFSIIRVLKSRESNRKKEREVLELGLADAHSGDSNLGNEEQRPMMSSASSTSVATIGMMIVSMTADFVFYNFYSTYPVFNPSTSIKMKTNDVHLQFANKICFQLPFIIHS